MHHSHRKTNEPHPPCGCGCSAVTPAQVLGKIDTAIAEAQRFISAAKRLKGAKQTRHNECKKWSDYSTVENANCPREQGALRRASMDLTRALADLRRPD